MGARFVVATTKFIVPNTAGDVIARPKLVKRLNESFGSRMVLIAAPPGSGKTTLLVEWVRQLACPVAWLSCDATDADPRRFWQSMTMSLRRTWPTVGLDADELLDEGNYQDLAVSLANDLGEVELPGVVVLDDFHLAHPDPAAMSALIRALPSSTTLVIGTRNDPPFALGRLRVQGQLREIRQQDLRLEQDEVDQFFDLVGADLSPDELVQLGALTEGWIAGAVLAGLYLQNKGSVSDLLRGLVATDRSMVDFLVNEVLDGLPDDVVEFLLTTAELESFDVGLCDAVAATGRERRRAPARRPGPQPVPRGAGPRGGLVPVPPAVRAVPAGPAAVDIAAAGDRHPRRRRRGVRRSRRRHGRRPPQHRRRRRARRVCGCSTPITRASTSPDDIELAATTARDWLRDHGAGAPADGSGRRRELPHHPELDVGAGRRRRMVAAPAPGQRGALRRRGPLPAPRHVELLLPAPGRTGADAARGAEIGEAIRRGDGVTNPWAPVLLHLLVQGYTWLDDLESAERELRGAGTGPPRPAITDVRVPAFGSYVAFLAGELDTAEARCREAYAAAERLGVHRENTGLAEPALTTAGLMLERGRLDEAEASLEQLLRIVEFGRRPQLELLGHLVYAQLMAARGDEVAVAVRLERGTVGPADGLRLGRGPHRPRRGRAGAGARRRRRCGGGLRPAGALARHATPRGPRRSRP